MSTEPEKVELETPDLAAETRAAFDSLLPGVLVDGVLDATRLGELLDTPVTAPADGRERFGLTWAGKQDAVRSLLTSSNAALVPDFGRSVDFDTAENVFIEGDNLEVLKLLQKAYNDRVKLIYIDPPYNTGNDFIYNDDFRDGLRGYLAYTGQLDQEGNRTSASADSAGRLHSKWLSMMYPRLILARNLLTEDGMLFVSINDEEITHLRALLDEVFGPENFLGQLIWMKGREGGNDNDGFGQHHEYVVSYARDKTAAVRSIALDPKDTSRHKTRLPELNRVLPGKETYRDGESFQLINLSKQKDYVVKVPLVDGTVIEWPSYAPQRTIDEFVRVGKLFVGSKGVPYVKSFLADEAAGTKPGTLLTSDFGTTKAGGIALRNLLGSGKLFSYPKPPALIQRLMHMAGVSDGDVILDFFAGSGTTAHAAALQDAADGKHRRWVLVNLPEPTDPASEAHQKGYTTVSAITYARVRAALESIDDAPAGLRAFVLDRSTFRREPSDAPPDLLDLAETTLADPDESTDTIAAEVLLKEGIPLDAAYVRTDAGGAPTVIAGGVAVVLSFEITDQVVGEALELGARVVVFLEDGFAGADAVKANAVTNARNLGITLKTV